LLCPFSFIYRRKEGRFCRPPRLGEQGCFHQKAPPSFGTLKKAQVGLVAICNPIFTKYTPFCGFFLLISFLNVVELYRLSNDTYFLFGMLQNFTDYAIMLIFPFEMSQNFTDYATMLVSRVPKGANKVQGPTASTPGRN